MGHLLTPKTVILETLRLHFGYPGHHFGDPGVQGDTQWALQTPRGWTPEVFGAITGHIEAQRSSFIDFKVDLGILLGPTLDTFW